MGIGFAFPGPKVPSVSGEDYHVCRLCCILALLGAPTRYARYGGGDTRLNEGCPYGPASTVQGQWPYRYTSLSRLADYCPEGQYPWLDLRRLRHLNQAAPVGTGAAWPGEARVSEAGKGEGEGAGGWRPHLPLSPPERRASVRRASGRSGSVTPHDPIPPNPLSPLSPAPISGPKLPLGGARGFWPFHGAGALPLVGPGKAPPGSSGIRRGPDGRFSWRPIMALSPDSGVPPGPLGRPRAYMTSQARTMRPRPGPGPGPGRALPGPLGPEATFGSFASPSQSTRILPNSPILAFGPGGPRSNWGY